METYQVGLAAIVMFLVLLVVALFSWKSKRDAQAALLEKPHFLEFSNTGVNALYVATVFASNPAKRVLAHGLTYRGRASVSVTNLGVGISRIGERSFLIPHADILGYGSSSRGLDKAVEKDGVTVIDWKLGREVLQTQFRFLSADGRQSFLDQVSETVGGRS